MLRLRVHNSFVSKTGFPVLRVRVTNVLSVLTNYRAMVMRARRGSKKKVFLFVYVHMFARLKQRVGARICTGAMKHKLFNGFEIDSRNYTPIDGVAAMLVTEAIHTWTQDINEQEKKKNHTVKMLMVPIPFASLVCLSSRIR